jgi:Protein of unknown function (DUF3455)
MSGRRTIAFALSVLSLSAANLAVHADNDATKSHAPTNLPKELAVPEGNRFAFQYRAEGVQIYTCQASDPAAPAWVLSGPEAKLIDARGRAAGKHFAGPTWEATDKSSVVGTKLTAYTAAATTIPWLLLQAASHSGSGVMSKVTYVQRLDTKGGLSPALGCDASHIGETARIDYTANYAFYEAKSKK